MDEKAKRMRDLLSSFYTPDPCISTPTSSISTSFDNINGPSFDADQYMDLMVSLPISIRFRLRFGFGFEEKKNVERSCGVD